MLPKARKDCQDYKTLVKVVQWEYEDRHRNDSLIFEPIDAGTRNPPARSGKRSAGQPDISERPPVPRPPAACACYRRALQGPISRWILACGAARQRLTPRHQRDPIPGQLRPSAAGGRAGSHNAPRISLPGKDLPLHFPTGNELP